MLGLKIEHIGQERQQSNLPMELSKVAEPPKIRVVVRKRPLTQKEGSQQDIVNIISHNALTVNEFKLKVDLTKYIEEHNFCFDNAFDGDADNQVIYDKCVLPLVAETFKGNKTTCFAYGQTGSGKTFTMMGTQDGRVPGLYLLASYDVIDLLNQYADLELYISFYEIYCGKLYDLLNNRENIFCREDGKQQVNIINLTEVKVSSVQEIMGSLSKGLELRASGSTGANADSSRSHAILTLSLKHNKREYSKMSFIDLAGNERGADTMNTDKQTQLDGAEINKSLLALKECIRALDLSKKHTPFRGSKLTQVLKDSFIGNSKTTMIANISPASANVEHTLNTLRYADRVKELKKGEKGSKEDVKMKEMMLARQQKNTRQIAIDQKTGAILEKVDKNSKPTKRSGSTMIGANRPMFGQQHQSLDPTLDKSRSEIPGLTNQNQRSASKGFSPGKSPRSRLPGSHSFIDRKHRAEQSLDFDEEQLREVDDEMEEDTNFEVHQVAVQDTPQQKLNGQKMDSGRQQIQRTNTTIKQPTSIGQGVSAIGSGIGGGLRRPTQIKVATTNTAVTNTSSSFAASNGINGHGISGSKIQNKFGAEPKEQNASSQQPSLMGKFGRQPESQDKKAAKPESKIAQPRAQVSTTASDSRSNITGSQISSFSNKAKAGNSSNVRPQTAASVPQQRISPRNNLQQQRLQRFQSPQDKPFTPAGDFIAVPPLGQDVQTYEELKEKYGDDTDDLCTDHEKLIEQILEEEDKLINCHRNHIDQIVGVVKEEMTLLNEVDKPGSDVEIYVKKLDEVLMNKIKLIVNLRKNLLQFYSHLKSEEQMSKLYQDNQELAIQNLKLNPQDVALETEDSKPDLYYNEENGKLEKRSTMKGFTEPQETKPSEDELLNRALDRLNKGLSGDLLADDETQDLMF